ESETRGRRLRDTGAQSLRYGGSELADGGAEMDIRGARPEMRSFDARLYLHEAAFPQLSASRFWPVECRAPPIRLDREGRPLPPPLLAPSLPRAVPGARRYDDRRDRNPSCCGPCGDGSSRARSGRDPRSAPPRPPEAGEEVPGACLPCLHQERPQALPGGLLPILDRLPGGRREP